MRAAEPLGPLPSYRVCSASTFLEAEPLRCSSRKACYGPSVVDIAQFEPMRRFAPEVLAEIVREAEARLSTQLQIASAADGRALSIAGFETTAATAALGAGIALAQGDHKDLWFTVLALLFSVVMVGTAVLAVSTVRPAKFSVPGNNPKNWLPDQWLGSALGDFSLTQARIEQAACLEAAISENSKWIEKAAARVRLSIDFALGAVAVAGVAMLATLAVRGA